MEKNDLIILSSDGLWDVIKQDQLQAIMERNTPEVKTKTQEREIELFICLVFQHLQDLADDLLSQAVDGKLLRLILFLSINVVLLGYIANGRDDILVIVCRVDSI